MYPLKRTTPKKRLAVVSALVAVCAASLATPAFAGTDYWGPVVVEHGRAFPGPNRRYLTGVYAAEESCGCHTVGAGAVFLGVSTGTGSAYRSFNGTIIDTPVIANGTGSLDLLIRGHANF